MAAVITEPGVVERAQGELPLTPVQILDRAIAWVQEHGWCQRAREYTDGRECTIGALCRGAGYSNFGSWFAAVERRAHAEALARHPEWPRSPGLRRPDDDQECAATNNESGPRIRTRSH